MRRLKAHWKYFKAILLEKRGIFWAENANSKKKIAKRPDLYSPLA
ncbi:MAG: hypothetical protein K0S07_1767 [Chlamydiales bacterium]|jgi:hypothetical protein|nr:hypothetical protein [Chlamydiales bacterium]